MTITETAERIVNEVENCNRYGDDMHARDKLVAIEIVSRDLYRLRDKTAQQAFDWIFERWNLDLGNKDRSLLMFLKQKEAK